MTTDGWDRIYSTNVGAKLTVHQYFWQWRESSSRLAVGEAKRSPPFSYPPDSRYGGKYPYGTKEWRKADAPTYQLWRIFSRLQTAPTAEPDGYGSTQWVGGMREDVICYAQAGGGVGVYGARGDEHRLSQAWEVGGADFSTPLPSWPWRQTPTHFSIDQSYSQLFMAPAAADALSGASEEIPWQGGSFTYTEEYGGAVMPSGCGPIGARLAPCLTVSGAGGSPRYSDLDTTIVSRRYSDGALLGTPGTRAYYRGRSLAIPYGSPTYCEGFQPCMVDLHYATLPTFRVRAWGYGSEGYLPEMTWFIQSFGVFGKSEQTITASYTSVTGYPSYLVSLDTSLDLNTVTFPPGTAFVRVFAGLAGGDYLACAEGAENCQFTASGTRSDIGASVYVPGRQIRVGTLTDAGVAT